MNNLLSRILLKSCKLISRYITNDKCYLYLYYFAGTGHILNLKDPKRFTEKLQWLKLNYYKPVYTVMVDKYQAKEYVKQLIGEQYVIPLLGVWDNFDDIDWNQLPMQFVLKTTHDQGGVVVVRDKTSMNFELIRKNFQKRLRRHFYMENRERPYREVQPRVIAEAFMEEQNDVTDLIDYKFYCFNGNPRFCQVIQGRHTNETIDFYDMDWKIMPFVGLNPRVKNSDNPIPCPSCFELVKSLVSILAKGMPFSRVDFYIINGRPYFGEITFYPNSGIGHFSPDHWDYTIGTLLHLPLKQL